MKSGWKKLKRALGDEDNVKRLVEESSEHAPHLEKGFSFLTDEEEHTVWKYKFADVVTEKMRRSKYEQRSKSEFVHQKNTLEKDKSPSVRSLQAEFFRQKQKTLMDRVNFAWKVLKEEPAPAATAPQSRANRWKEAAKKAAHSANDKKGDDFYNIVVALRAQQKQVAII